MKLEYSADFEDIRFVLRYFNQDATAERMEHGVRLTAGEEVCDGLDGVLQMLLTRHGGCSEKRIREAKRLRTEPEVRKTVDIAGLLSFHSMYRAMLVGGSLKNKAFVDEMAALVSPVVRVDTDFQLLDVQAAEITAIEDAPGLDKLYCEEVVGRRRMTVLSGLREHVRREELLGGRFLFVANMKPASFKGLVSEGMILCVRDGDGCVEPIAVPRDVENGTRLGLEGHEMLAEEFSPAVVDMRKKSYEEVLHAFRVADHFLAFKGVRVLCNGSPVRTRTANGIVR